MKNKKKKSINLLAVEVFLLLTATVLTTATILNKRQIKEEKTEEKTQQNQIEQKGEIAVEKKEKYEINNFEEESDDENYIEENFETKNESLEKDDEESFLAKKNTQKKNKKDLVVIGSYETSLETKQEREKNRIHNIKTAAKFLDGVTIKPGAIFSFHRNTWDCGKKKEYKFADTLTQNGMDKGLGGGVCQVSSTLFVAALISRIDILERYSHSKQVRYAPLGLDASYVTGTKDLKFKNTRKTPIIIKTYYSENKLKIEIIGEEDEKDKNYKVILHPAKKEINEKTKKIKTDVLVETLYKGETIKKAHFYSEYNIN